jgi:arylsulfatase A
MCEIQPFDEPLDRREFIRAIGFGAATLAAGQAAGCAPGASARKPNIVFIMADDLGYGELGSYGQEKIRTPNLDRLAAQGMRFTQHYSGSPVCAPSRCVLLTGLHSGHAYIRGNDEMSDRGDVWRDLSLEGQRPLLAGTTTIGTILQNSGYTTGAMGKWGLGGPGSEGAPNLQGFDRWYGYLGQRLAHNYYPVHLWSDSTKVDLDNEYFHPHQRLPEDADPNDPASYEPYRGNEYAPDRIIEATLDFVRDNAADPFFLFVPFTIPHVSLQLPDEDRAEYEGEFEETPYLGDRSYVPQQKPRAAYAGMITRMDKDVGRILDLLSELGLEDDTIVFFTSDNGPTWVSGVDFEFFGSQGGLRGRKAQLWEGGIRVPLIARWPRRIQAGSVSDFPSAFWDFMPTLAELAQTPSPTDVDGVSLVPTLLGRSDEQTAHEYLYWEYVGGQVVRLGDYKGIRLNPDAEIELYDLAADLAETTDLAAEHEDVVVRISEIMVRARTESELFPLRGG